ncbi:MAG: YggS family pyridoxal phosphate-dependent enzyme [Longimicrobiales bacterium]|nr:YggS family pyridoxal phosphate-dependent enzyme [Longimicrobiales bacterium]
MYAERLQETLPRVREVIRDAAHAAGRTEESVRLVAVTKGHPLAAVRAALAAGLTDLGENRVGELEEKVRAVGREGVRWHMIGHVQRRKAPALVGLAHLVHSVDRIALAERLGRAAVAAQSEVSVLVQVNTSGEEAKGGFPLREAVEGVLRVAETAGLRVEGLMTMAPYVDDERVLRQAFGRLREALADVRRHDARVGGELSMGMSNDLRWAVEEGSTMVRIGTALLGPRTPGEAPAGREVG